jgi:hypothetical protein
MSSAARDATTSKYRLGVLVAVFAGEKFPRHSEVPTLSKKGFNVEKNT